MSLAGVREILKYRYTRSLIPCVNGQRRSFMDVLIELLNLYNLLRIQNGITPIADLEGIW